jgi:hypothetical protein
LNAAAGCPHVDRDDERYDNQNPEALRAIEKKILVDDGVQTRDFRTTVEGRMIRRSRTV